MNTITVLNPGVEAAGPSAPPAAPLLTRRSSGPLRIALLDNTKVNAIELFEAIACRLQEKLPVEVKRWRKRHAGESGAAAIAELARWQPQLVLTGLGD